MKKRIKQFITAVHGRMYMQQDNRNIYLFKHDGIEFVLITNERDVAVVTKAKQHLAFHTPGRTYIQDIFPELTGMERQYIDSGFFFGKFDGQSFNKMDECLKIMV